MVEVAETMVVGTKGLLAVTTLVPEECKHTAGRRVTGSAICDVLLL